MRALLAASLAVALVTALGPTVAADDWPGGRGPRVGQEPQWRRTSPRVEVLAGADALAMRVPAGRAWGIESGAIPVEPGARYLAGARIDVPEAAGVRGAFARVAVYDRAGRVAQRRILDTAIVGATAGADARVGFVAPSWARAVRLRLLARRDATVAAGDPLRASWPWLRRRTVPPEVILRE